jgi:hypothetical protein
LSEENEAILNGCKKVFAEILLLTFVELSPPTSSQYRLRDGSVSVSSERRIAAGKNILGVM